MRITFSFKDSLCPCCSFSLALSDSLSALKIEEKFEEEEIGKPLEFSLSSH